MQAVLFFAAVAIVSATAGWLLKGMARHAAYLELWNYAKALEHENDRLKRTLNNRPYADPEEAYKRLVGASRTENLERFQRSKWGRDREGSS